MRNKNLKCLSLILLGIMMLAQTNLTSGGSGSDSIYPGPYPVISRLHTLSIHVRDTLTHDSIFHFLVDKLKLPVYYFPITLGERKYAGVYAGNLVLEPCGPYSSFLYATNDFKAIFFGLTFEPSKSIPLTSISLIDKEIQHDVEGDEYIYLKDSALCGDNITVSIMDRHEKIKDLRRMDSLRYSITMDNNNALGIEYVKEIWVGYTNRNNLNKWRELMNNKIWKESNILESPRAHSPMLAAGLASNKIKYHIGDRRFLADCCEELQFHFIQSNIKEVTGITFKVRSLEKAKQYLLKNNLIGSFNDNKIELDRAQSYGLSIYLTEKK